MVKHFDHVTVVVRDLEKAKASSPSWASSRIDPW
jgi:hypothetical protein